MNNQEILNNIKVSNNTEEWRSITNEAVTVIGTWSQGASLEAIRTAIGGSPKTVADVLRAAILRQNSNWVSGMITQIEFLFRAEAAERANAECDYSRSARVREMTELVDRFYNQLLQVFTCKAEIERNRARQPMTPYERARRALLAGPSDGFQTKSLLLDTGPTCPNDFIVRFEEYLKELEAPPETGGSFTDM